MTKKYSFLLFALCFFSSVHPQIVNIPDANFKAKLLEADVVNLIAKDKDQKPVKIDLNGDGEIQQSELMNVWYLNIPGSNISSLTGIKSFVDLRYFDCSGNKLTLIDVSNMPNLLDLNCNFQTDHETILNLDGLINLRELSCEWNQLTNLDVSQLINLSVLDCGYNKLTNLDISKLYRLETLFCFENQLTALELSGQNPDYFRSLHCSANMLTNLDIAKFNNLLYLSCGQNELTSLNITAFTTLESLSYYFTKISDFDVTRFPNLTELDCSWTETTVLDLTGLTKLEYLSCTNNKLTSLNLSNIKDLKYLSCEKNMISSLDITNAPNLESLAFGNKEIAEIDLKKSVKLKQVFIEDTSIKSLDVNNSSFLEYLIISLNPLLESLFIKNGNAKEEIYFYENPNLKYVCVDEDQITKIENSLKEIGYVDFTVNSYCSFAPAGESFTIQGYNRNDSDNNGCNSNDIPASFLKFEISNGTKTGRLITNETGNYAIKVPAGSYTITPVFENPDYFSISPASMQVDFPAVASPVLQDFCITPVDSHKDLEVTLLPITAARPGFQSDYKIIFKNKGNVAQSGNVNLLFQDAVLDLLNATPVVSNQSSNNLSWNFTNLKPFESREIKISLKVNSPIQTPAVLNGDILNYTATISSSQTDEKPIDNTFALSQTVVGSYDPNDKTCLEGNIIKPELIGEYVHYMIRFENTGTYQAENVVVKDLIDLSKFDINTLVPASSSHSYITKISDGNKVEFIFEKINLPFDDANNDGYIAFKIKTLPTLTVGDSFTNEANIYFDYNLPILTNKATSTFKTTLNNQDFDFGNYFNIYPNPAKDVLNIGTKDTIEIKSLAVYDVLGQIVIAVPNAEKVSTVDVSKLQKGNYILKVKTNKGTSASKFIKM